MHVASYTVGPKKAIAIANQIPLFEDIRTIFFLLSVSARLSTGRQPPPPHNNYYNDNQSSLV